jgi:hypothetical protein
MTRDIDPPRHGSSADGPKVLCFPATNLPPIPPEAAALQAELVAFPHRRGRQRPRRIEAQISVRDGPAPIGRSRRFLLTLDELLELIAHLESIEARG